MSKEENEPIKRQIGVVGDKENTWKKYLYFENGVLVGQQCVKIENGLEIPYQEDLSQTTHTLTIPPNIENEENFKVVDNATGEVKLINIIRETPQVEFLKLYNETRNIGIINRLENGLHVSSVYFKIENNKEIICEQPEENFMLFIPLPTGSPNFSSHKGELSMYDVPTGKLIRNIPKANIIEINKVTELKIKEQNEELSKEIITKINELSNEDKEQLIENIHKKCEPPVTTLEGRQIFTSTIEQVAETIGNLINEIEEIPSDFYKTVDPKEEFGISRVVADKIYNLPKILENAKLVRQGETTTYIIQAEGKRLLRQLNTIRTSSTSDFPGGS